MLTIEQINSLWLNDNFKKSVKFCANVIAQFIISEPNYGRDYIEPASQIEARIISYWQKRYDLAVKIIRYPDNGEILRMLVSTLVSGVSEINSPITFDGNGDVNTPFWTTKETDSIAGYLKAVWNNMSGVRSNEYPWSGSNGSIQEPTPDNWYSAHFSDLPNKFI